MRDPCREGHLFEEGCRGFLGRSRVSCRMERRERRKAHNWCITGFPNCWFGGWAVRKRGCEVIEPTIQIKGFGGGRA